MKTGEMQLCKDIAYTGNNIELFVGRSLGKVGCNLLRLKKAEYKALSLIKAG